MAQSRDRGYFYFVDNLTCLDMALLARFHGTYLQIALGSWKEDCVGAMVDLVCLMN